MRYPGGKAKLANFIKLVFLENGLVGCDYVEPYAGGASVALSLLFEDYAGHVHINDINPGVHAFWDAVLNSTEALCDRIAATSITVNEWRRQRDVHRSASKADPLDLAFATFFLNRTNRSGIISGGVIGGLDQTGPWKIDARYNTTELIQRIRKIGRFRSRITLTQLDAAEILRNWAATEDIHAFLYLDPPYYVKGGELYDNFYQHADHAVIAELVRRLPHNWLVTYDAAPEVIQMYSASKWSRYGLHYSAHERVRGSEVAVTSPGLVLPDHQPAGVSSLTVERARMPVSPFAD